MADCNNKRTPWHCLRTQGGCGWLVGHRIIVDGHMMFEPLPGVMVTWTESATCVRCPKCGRLVKVRGQAPASHYGDKDGLVI